MGNSKNRSESFTFSTLPTDAAQLQALPEATLDSPFKTAALTIAVLCHYEQDVQATMEMLDFLKGPGEVSTYEKQFIRERLEGKGYKVRSFFNGATVANGYTPELPYTISVSENPYSYPDENWATLYVTSAGADSPRGIKMRKKPSTGQWFLNEIQCLSDIRVPAEEDPWA
ncbi:MAG: hypothetical protein E7430_02015 [Ruminococcaceae bacterium]|nr:hypothetical protein [Oscillospiraceae bacterium]